jgi:3-oxoacyl-[acyl-carrier protein] reductase
MDLGIAGRTAAVAGASAGLGLAVAKRLGICGRDRERLAKARSEIDGEVVTVVRDLSLRGGPESFIEEVTALLGGVDILVANNGGPPVGNFASTPLDAYQKALEATTMSTIAMCREAIPPMCARRWGRVLTITSISVRQPIPELILSNTARSGLTGFLKTVAREVAADGVTVNSLQPGLHATTRVREVYGERLQAEQEKVPARAVGDPEDFGAVAAMLCSEHARYVTGAAIPVDGGSYAGLQ